MYTTPHHLLMALSSLYVYEVSGSPVALVSDPQGPQGGGGWDGSEELPVPSLI